LTLSNCGKGSTSALQQFSIHCFLQSPALPSTQKGKNSKIAYRMFNKIVFVTVITIHAQSAKTSKMMVIGSKLKMLTLLSSLHT